MKDCIKRVYSDCVAIQQRPDLDFIFPIPLFNIGQTVWTEQGENCFIVGLSFNGNGWEYQLYYLDLDVTGSKLINENKLSNKETLNISTTKAVHHLSSEYRQTAS
jgi:hypothetical protein